MSKKQIPKTKDECFALLDKELSVEDKRFLLEDEAAAVDVHFSLGMWIRNNWIYKRKEEDLRNLMKQFADHPLDLNMMCYSPDMASQKIIESYIEHLKENQ
jgi:hypothetical protein